VTDRRAKAAKADRPPASSETALRRMKTQRRRDTTPELALRRELHRRGLRYRLEVDLLGDSRRRCDIVFPRSKVACFVDGCFWHSCPDHGTVPKSNRDWWIEKLDNNVTRDRDTDERLAKAGWLVIRIWEHEEPAPAADFIERAVRSRSAE
jgi:DNA mismatch endonuclease (patch repair protein)